MARSSTWMAEHVVPNGHVVAVDLDLSLVNDVDAPRVEFRKGDIVAAPQSIRAVSI